MRTRAGTRRLEGMDLLSALPLPAALGLLALLDGLSVGTLLIPVFFLIAPGRPRVGRIILYLGTITLFYLAVGVLFTLGLVSVVDVGREFLDSTAGQTVLFVVGLGMLGAGILMGVSDARTRKAGATVSGVPEAGDAQAAALARTQPGEHPAGHSGGSGSRRSGGRILAWRDRLLAPHTSRGTVIAVALAAGLVEVATMLPYLIGMTMLANSPMSMSLRIVLLAGYCIVMIVPALVLLAARVAAARAVEGPLQRLAAWLQRTGAENTAWILGIFGFLLARAGASQLGLGLPFIG